MKAAKSAAERKRAQRERERGLAIAVPRPPPPPPELAPPEAPPGVVIEVAPAELPSDTVPVQAEIVEALPALGPPPPGPPPPPPSPEEVARQDSTAQLFAAGVLLLFRAGCRKRARVDREVLTDEEIDFLEGRGEARQVVDGVISQCAASVGQRYALRLPYAEEAVVAAAIGFGSWGLFGQPLPRPQTTKSGEPVDP